MPGIMIGCPVRNRAWILPRYLQCLQNLDFPAELISYCFVINDSTDLTADLLSDFASTHEGKVKLIFADQGTKRTRTHYRGNYNFDQLSRLRNSLLDVFLHSNCSYLFSVDSDILVPPDSLNSLLEDRCDIVSALVCNGYILGDAGIFNILNYVDGQWIHLRGFPRDRVFRVDCTGAAYLIKRKVIEEYGVRYSAHYGAEDIGFCRDAANKGLQIFCDGRIECQHIMAEPVEM